MDKGFYVHLWITLNTQNDGYNYGFFCGFLEEKAGNILIHNIFGIIKIDWIHAHCS